MQINGYDDDRLSHKELFPAVAFLNNRDKNITVPTFSIGKWLLLNHPITCLIYVFSHCAFISRKTYIDYVMGISM
jgi:hypothetical protein